MKSLAARRTRSIIGFLIVASLLIAGVLHFASELGRAAIPTGWILLFALFFLAAYQIRKKIPLPWLGSASTWLQIHIYIGLMTFVLFILHTGLQFPDNLFNQVLFCTYMVLFFSGLIGLFLTRYIPGRITASGEEILFERIPAHIHKLRLEVEQLIEKLNNSEDVESEATLATGIIQNEIREFFSGPKNQLYHLVQSSKPRKQLINRLQYHKQILNEDEKEILAELIEKVIAKDHLDYSWTMQAVLKLWLFIHVPLTYGLIVLALFHLVVVSAFYGASL